MTTTADEVDAGACPPGDTDCALREAVVAAAASSEADTINVPAGRYVLTIARGSGVGSAADGDLDLGDPASPSGNLTITGAGARATTVDGGGLDRVFEVQPGQVAEISGLTVTGGNSPVSGGGVQVADGAADGTLTLRSVTVSGNFADGDGGGIDNNGNLTVIASTISGNRTEDQGGGIEHDDTTTVINSTISANRADGTGSDGGGGGFDNDGDDIDAPETEGQMTVTNSTITGNTTAGTGGGITNDAGGSFGEATFKNTIVGGNSADLGGANCSGVEDITSAGGNLESGDTCEFTASGDQRNADPQLGPLQDNGGQTDTHALPAGSPAVDLADAGACPATDQRGVQRPQGSGCDVGAFEFAPPTTTPTPIPTPAPAPAPTAVPVAAAPGPQPAGAVLGVRIDSIARLPSARRCVSRRSFRIRLRAPGGERLVRAEVYVNGRRVRVVRGRRLTAPVDLRGLPKGRFRIEIRVTTASGKRLAGKRRYRTCVPKRRAGRRPPPV